VLNMSIKKSCTCCSSPKLIFSCSGASDLGAIADQAARRLTHKGVGRIFCLAGIGGGVSGILKVTEAAKDILVIDGCPTSCAKKCLEKAGFSGFKHLQVTDLGMEKGKTEINDVNIDKVVESGAALLQDECS
jgi:uncharacterized metal-binding protein